MDQREFKKRLADLAAGKITHDDLLSDLKPEEPKPHPKAVNKEAPKAVPRKQNPAPASELLFEEPASPRITTNDIKKLRTAFLETKESFPGWRASWRRSLGRSR